MIYTCTVNPSLDYYLEIDREIKFGSLNRLKSESYQAGGKGVNVSIVLNNLELPSVALGFLGGFTRDYYLSFLRAYRFIQPRFTQILGHTRINVKLVGRYETNLNALGPKISDEEFERFLNRVDKIDEGDIFILSGNVQTELYPKLLKLIADLSARKVQIIIDSNPKLMQEALKYHPLLIKPEFNELEEICGRTIHSKEDILAAVAALNAQGAENVIVALGRDGAILINQEAAYRYEPDEEKIVCLSCAGDALIGGYVFNLQRGADDLEAFAYACAASYATMQTEGIAKLEAIERAYDQIKIKKIK